jgi:hypothetical protein
MRFTLKSLKEELKQLAADIKVGKPAFKDTQRNLSHLCIQLGIANLSWYERWTKTKHIKEYNDAVSDMGRKETTLAKMRYEYRHKHIVYCILRGKTRDQIEKPKEQNKPNEKYLGELTEHYMFLVEEEAKHVQIVCGCATGSI